MTIVLYIESDDPRRTRVSKIRILGEVSFSDDFFAKTILQVLRVEEARLTGRGFFVGLRWAEEALR